MHGHTWSLAFHSRTGQSWPLMVQSGVTKATTLHVPSSTTLLRRFWQKMALHSGALEDALGRRVPTCGGSSSHLEQKQSGAHWHPSPSISSEELSDLKPHRSQQPRPYVRALQPRQRRQQGQTDKGIRRSENWHQNQVFPLERHVHLVFFEGVPLRMTKDLDGLM